MTTFAPEPGPAQHVAIPASDLPAAVGAPAVDRLRQALTVLEAEPADAGAAAPPAGRRERARHLIERGRSAGPRALVLAVRRRGAGRARAAVLGLLGDELDQGAQAEALARAAYRLATPVPSLERGLAGLSERGVRAQEVALDVRSLQRHLDTVADKLGEVEDNVNLMAMAVAPAAGAVGAAVRLAELRDRLNALERRVRHLPSGTAAAALAAAPVAAGDPADGAAGTDPALPAVAGGPAAPSAPATALLDYAGLERRFRGDPEVVRATLRERYLDLLAPFGPVVDLGCGGGQLVEDLAAAGTSALGVDSDPPTVADAVARGVDVRLDDAAGFLRAAAPQSFGAVIAVHVVEHLGIAELVELLDLAARALRPGGLLVLETPNPMSLVVLGNSFILDPTHVWPMHPSLLEFLAEGAGFNNSRLLFHAPAEDYQLDLVDDLDAPRWTSTVNAGFARLNEVLFGPQEYTLVARRSAEPDRHSPPEQDSAPEGDS